MRIAVVTVVSGRHGHLRNQLAGLDASSVTSDDHVVVAMNDPAISGIVEGRARTRTVEMITETGAALPLAAARNRGAAAALADGAQLIIFLDVDCIPAPDLVRLYRSAALENEDRVALLCGPVAYLPPPPAGGYDLGRLAEYASPHPGRPDPAPGTIETGDDHRLFWSLSFAVTPQSWQTIGGFSEAYQGYGAEDTDLAEVARTRGVELLWVGGALAHHQHHPVSNPPVEHLEDILINAATFRDRWGWWPMQTWLQAFERAGLVAYRPETDTWTRLPPERGIPSAGADGPSAYLPTAGARPATG